METKTKAENKRQAQVRTFTEGKILLPLVRFALPVLVALFLQAMYGAVDLLIGFIAGVPGKTLTIFKGLLKIGVHVTGDSLY